MDAARHWKYALALSAMGCLVGCKAPWGGNGAATAAKDAKSTYAGLTAGTTTAATPESGSLGLQTARNPLSRAWDATTAAFNPKPKPADDPTSLSSKPKKIGAETYVAAGKLLESQQKFDRAQAKYEEALKVEPNNLSAMVSLGRLHDRAGRYDKAIEQYKKAIQLHPESGMAYNDLGLCYARRKDLGNAAACMTKAVELEPGKPNYRNNLATVLVDMGRTDEALRQLQSAHPAAVAHYNLAYLLEHRGQTDLARVHLAEAIKIDPLLAPAQEMLAQINGGADASAPQSQLAIGPAVEQPASQPMTQVGPYGGTPQQQALPPTQIEPEQTEPVFHIGRESVETTPATEGPNVYQPTSHQTSRPAVRPAPAVYNLSDSGGAGALVVKRLVRGKDRTPAPSPQGLVEDSFGGRGVLPASDAQEPVEQQAPIRAQPLYPAAN